MNKSRKIKGLIALVLLALALAACGGSNSKKFCVTYNGQTRCESIQAVRKGVKRADKALTNFTAKMNQLASQVQQQP